MSVTSLRKEIQDMHNMMKPETPSTLVVFLDEDENIVEIQGHDVTNYTQEEVNRVLDSVPVHYYLPKPEPEDLE